MESSARSSLFLIPLLDKDVREVNKGMNKIDRALDAVKCKERHFVQGNHEVWLDKFVTRYPRGSEQYGKATKVCGWFESIGTLYKQDLISGELLFDWITVKLPWSRLGNFAVGVREAAGEPRLYENFEAMAKEESMK